MVSSLAFFVQDSCESVSPILRPQQWPLVQFSDTFWTPPLHLPVIAATKDAETTGRKPPAECCLRDRKRIDPLDPGETIEILIIGKDRTAMFERERSDHCICREIAPAINRFQQVEEDRERVF